MSNWVPYLPAKVTSIKNPVYDIHRTYLENAEEGPFFSENIPKRILPPKEEWKDFLGYKIASPIGIPAGPLLNARWIEFASKLGFDVLCYKTIRSHTHPGHPLPNIIYVDGKEQLSPKHLPPHLLQLETPPQSLSEIGITNSFGMPSRTPDFIQQDIGKAVSSIQEGQVLIVSIVGTPPAPKDYQGFIKDFVTTAHLAKEGGAQIIEANFSCPNVSSTQGSLYLQPKYVYEISSHIIKAIHDIPLIIKVGIFPNKHLMLHTFAAAARAGVQGISGINTIGMPVIKKNGEAALGPERLSSGICGNPIREAALRFIQKARQIIDHERFDFTLLGCGGVVLPEHFSDFFQSGADIALTATGMMWNPYLAHAYSTMPTAVPVTQCHQQNN